MAMGVIGDLLGRHLEGFLLAFFRMGAMLVAAPVLGHRSTPVAHRAGLAILLALLVTPALGAGAASRDALGWLVAVAGEITIGLTIGFIAQLALAAVEIAGELIALGMGLSIAAVFDPARGEQETVVASFLNTLAMLMFLAMDGHHLLIRAAAVSFERIPPGGMIAPAAAGGVVSLGARLVQSGFALAAPLVAILIVVNVVLALLGKAAPQANVFLLGLPLSLGLGLLGMFDDLPGFAQSFARLVTEMRGQLDVLVLGAAHGPR